MYVAINVHSAPAVSNSSFS